MKVQATQIQSTNKTYRCIKACIGYKRYSGYARIYCLDSQGSPLAVQTLDKDRIRFTMPQYKYSEVMLLSLETALYNVKKCEVLLEEIDL